MSLKCFCRFLDNRNETIKAKDVILGQMKMKAHFLLDRKPAMGKQALKRLTKLNRRVSVVKMHLEGISPRIIASWSQVAYATVYRWLSEWEDDIRLYQDWLQKNL